MAKLPAALASNPLFYALVAVVIVGALNWLLVGLFDFDLVVWLVGLFDAKAKQPKVDHRPATRALYGLVGAAAIMLIVVLSVRR
jgi:uncharacterized membrane protein YuzA (DUF378 family)